MANQDRERVTIVTGASGGLGAAVVTALDRTGAAVVAVGHRPGGIESAIEGFSSLARHLVIEGVDLASAAGSRQVIEAAVHNYGRIDALVNTIGGFRSDGPLQVSPVELLDEMMALNARTVYVMCQAVIPQMLDQGTGRIVNVASRAGFTGSAGFAAFSASKAAVLRLTESLSQEVKNQGINVNCVIPGTMDTPENRKARPEASFDRWVSPTDVAKVILFLISDDASAIHGATLPVLGLT